MSVCIDDVVCWMSSNRLQLNAAKTEFLWCSAAWRQNQLPTLPFRVCNDLITPSIAVRDLGTYLDSDVKMETQVSRTVSHCLGILRRLRSNRHSLSSSVSQSLVASLVLSRLDYDNATLAGITSLQLRRLQSVINAAAQLVFFASWSHLCCVVYTGFALPSALRTSWRCWLTGVYMDLLRLTWLMAYIRSLIYPADVVFSQHRRWPSPFLRHASRQLVIVLFRQLHHGHGTLFRRKSRRREHYQHLNLN